MFLELIMTDLGRQWFLCFQRPRFALPTALPQCELVAVLIGAGQLQS